MLGGLDIHYCLFTINYSVYAYLRFIIKEEKMSGGQTAITMRNLQKLTGLLIRCLVVIVLWSRVTPNSAAAQTIPVMDVSVAVMPFTGDEPALNSRIRDVTLSEVENLEGFTPRPLDAALPQSDAPPDADLLEGIPYALTGEYYFDDEDMQHFQVWLWNGASGALIFTDELVAAEVEEAEEYLPPLVKWVFSKAMEDAAEESGAEEIRIEEIGMEATGEEIGPAIREMADTEVRESGPGEKSRFQLYLGLRGGASLDFQIVRPVGNYEVSIDQSFGGEGALTVEFRPWRYVGFQAEGIFVLESFAPYRVQGAEGLHISDRYQSMYLFFPLLVKIPLSLDSFRLAPLIGPYYILSLGKTMNGSSYQDKLGLPLGVMVGFDLGYALGGGRFGELYGSLRYGTDLDLTTVEETGLRYTRGRLAFSLGYRFMLLGREK
jgi:hypothetical protein